MILGLNTSNMIERYAKWSLAECSVDDSCGVASALALHREARWLMSYPEAENRFP